MTHSQASFPTSDGRVCYAALASQEKWVIDMKNAQQETWDPWQQKGPPVSIWESPTRALRSSEILSSKALGSVQVLVKDRYRFRGQLDPAEHLNLLGLRHGIPQRSSEWTKPGTSWLAVSQHVMFPPYLDLQ